MRQSIDRQLCRFSPGPYCKGKKDRAAWGEITVLPTHESDARRSSDVPERKG
jgi:hypothetical protein